MKYMPLKTCPSTELQKGGSDRIYRVISLFTLVLVSLGLGLSLEFSESWIPASMSLFIVAYWPPKGLGIAVSRRTNYQQSHHICDFVQSEDLGSWQLRSLSVYIEKWKETRTTPNGQLFGELSLSRIMEKSDRLLTAMASPYNWYLCCPSSSFVVHRYPFVPASGTLFCIVFSLV